MKGLPGAHAALNASYTGQRTLADQIALAEPHLKAHKLAQQAESTNSRDILRQAARDCESWHTTRTKPSSAQSSSNEGLPLSRSADILSAPEHRPGICPFAHSMPAARLTPAGGFFFFP